MLKIKIIFLVIVLFSTINLFAQKPEKGAIGATAGLSAIAGVPTTDASTTGSLLLRYYLKDDWVLRGAMNYRTVASASKTVTDSTIIPAQQGIPTGDGFTRRTKDVTGGAFNFEFGIQKNIGNIENVEVFVAGVFVTGLEGKRKTYSTTEWLKDQGSVNRVVGDYDYVTATTPIKTRYGANIIVGANYFVNPNLSIGAEFGYGYASIIEKGGEVVIESKKGVNVVSNTYSTEGFSDLRNSFQVTGAVLTLSFFF